MEFEKGNRVRLLELYEHQYEKFAELMGEVDFHQEFAESGFIGKVLETEGDKNILVKFADGQKAWFLDWCLELVTVSPNIDVVNPNSCINCELYLDNGFCLLHNVETDGISSICDSFEEV